MPEYTSNFTLPKPLPNENVSRAAHNELVQAIDTNVGSAFMSHLAEKAKYQVATGSDTIAITTGGNFALTQGNYVKWIQASANTGAVTINVDSKGAKALKNSDKGVLAAGDLEAAKGYEAYYSQGDDFFVLPPRGAKLTDIITAIQGKGGTVASPQKVPEIVSAINAVATWDADIQPENILNGKSIFGVAGIVNTVTLSPGTIKVLESAASVNVSSSGYTKYKEIKINFAGAVRVKFSMMENLGVQYIYGRIYKNGLAVGTERQALAGPLTFTEDINVTSNDLIQIYCKTLSAAASVSAFEVSILTNAVFGTVNL